MELYFAFEVLDVGGNGFGDVGCVVIVVVMMCFLLCLKFIELYVDYNGIMDIGGEVFLCVLVVC